MVETLAPLRYGKVVGRWVAIVGDSVSDVDKSPDAIPLTGTVVLTPQAPLLRVATATPVPTTAMPQEITCTVVNGYLTYGGDQFVWLLATDDPAVNPQNYTWRATVNLVNGATALNPYSFLFAVPTWDAAANGGAGNPVDLTVDSPLQQDGSTLITKGLKGDPGPGWIFLGPAEAVPAGTAIPTLIVRLSAPL
jgi:hypothetical protein